MAVQQGQGLTAEMYRAVVAIVDDRTQEIRVMRKDFDRLEERMGRVEAALDRLAEAQARTEERLDRLEATVARLAEAQARTEEQIQDLVQSVRALENRQASIVGKMLEWTYQRRAGSYLGPLMRQVKAWVPFELEDELEPRLSSADYLDLLNADLIVRGRPREISELPQLWLAVEVSAVVDRGDVERAVRRAGHLRKAGYAAMPAVAGEQATEGAEDMARQQGVLMVVDGRIAFWKEALACLLPGER